MSETQSHIPVPLLQPGRQEPVVTDQRLSELFQREKPFLQHGYTIGKLADDLGISLHRLSAFINQHHDMHFNDLINKYRVLYCIDTFREKEWKDRKLSALAEAAGFNNRNTFITAFKKFTGLSPSKYFANTYKSQPESEVIASSADRQ